MSSSFSESVRSVLSDTMALPPEFLNYLIQYAAINPVPTRDTPGNLTVHNVKTGYGAAGDGVTDDTQAIKTAIEVASNASGGIIYFPTGTYLISSYLELTTGGITLSSTAGATLKLSSGFTRGSQGQGHILVSSVNDVTIDGLRFDGNKSSLTHDATNNFAVWVNTGLRVVVRNCYAANVNSSGSNVNSAFVWAGSSHYAKAIGNTIENCGGGGIFMQGADCMVVGNSLVSCGDVGIVFNSSTSRNNTAIGNVVDAISSQCAFGCENGASTWTITGNSIQECFGALDLNDAGYSGTQQVGGIFSNNTITDMDKGSSAQTITCGVLYRTAHTRDVRIVNNVFSGLVPYGTTDAFVFVNSATVDGLTIRGNLFEALNNSVPAGVIFAASSSTVQRIAIAENRFWSTGTNNIGSGIWFANSPTISTTEIASNTFENVTNAVRFDTPTVNGLILRDNKPLAGVTDTYLTSRWGTLDAAHTVFPHTLSAAPTAGNGVDRSVWWASAIPTGGTWIQGDRIWNFAAAAAGVPGWVCTTGGTPGTWKAMAALAA